MVHGSKLSLDGGLRYLEGEIDWRMQVGTIDILF